MSHRFHTMSLFAVFLALTAGMVIGALFLQDPTLNTTRNQISALRVRADQLKTDNDNAVRRLQEVQEQLRRSGGLLAPRVADVVRDRLRFRNVAIVQAGEYPEAAAAVAQTVRAAGGRVTATITLETNKLTEEAQKAAVNWLKKLPAGADTSGLEGLNGAMVSPEDGPLPPTRLVVVVGGHKMLPDNSMPSTALESAVIDALQTLDGVAVVGAEPLEAEFSSVSVFVSKNIPSIDCIDLPVGQMALPFLIDRDEGAYGLKRSATDVMPEEALRLL